MSNRLINQVQQLRQIVPVGAKGVALPARDLHPSEMAVLMALANDARDVDGDVSKLRTVKIMARTRLSEPAVRKAYRQLQANGHITRIRGNEGEQSVTKVHPRLTPFTTTAADTWVSSVSVSPISNTGNPCIEDMGLIDHRIQPIDHSPLASAREADFEGFQGPAPQPVPAPAAPVPPPAPATRELEPVDQVFAAWDAWRDRAGLPGPVTRNAARRVGVARAIEAQGLGKVLMSIDTVERGVKAGRFRRRGAAGQDDLWATFDALFDVGHARELNLLARLLDGEFGAVVPAAAAPAVKECLTVAEAGDPEQRMRAAIGKRIGAAAARQWIDPLVFDWRGDELRAVAPTAFHADWVTEHFASHLRGAAGGAAVRVVVREKV